MRDYLTIIWNVPYYRFVLFNQFYVRLLDHSVLLKAKHDELIHELIFFDMVVKVYPWSTYYDSVKERLSNSYSIILSLV